MSYEELNVAKKNKIISIISKIIDKFNAQDNNTVKYLLDLFAESKTIDPALFNMSFLDFLMDEEMWGWIFSSADKDELENMDFLALTFIINDLKERLQNNEIFA